MATVTNFYSASFTPLAIALVERSGVNQTLSAIRSGAGTNVFTTGNIGVILASSSTTNQFASLDRVIVTFDTSSIPANATLTGGEVVIDRASSKENGLGSPSIHLVSSNPANPASIVAADYSTLGSSAFSTLSYSNFTLLANNTFNLAAGGLANVTKNGTSKFGFRTDWDLNNNFTGSWSSTMISWLLWDISRNTVTLTVNYTVDFPSLSLSNLSSISNVTTATTS